MPLHRQYRSPVVEFGDWLFSAMCRVCLALWEVGSYYGVALLDAAERLTRWWHNRLKHRWRWQMSATVVLLVCAAVTFVSLR